MGEIKIYPRIKNVDHKTVVIIEPTFQCDYSIDDYVHPAVYVEVEYYVKGDLVFKFSFKKVINWESYRDDFCNVNHASDMGVVRVAEDLINKGLNTIGLDGLNTLDIYDIASGRLLDKNTIIDILTKKLELTYYNEEDIDGFINHGGTLVIPSDGFYELEITLPSTY